MSEDERELNIVLAWVVGLVAGICTTVVVVLAWPILIIDAKRFVALIDRTQSWFAKVKR